MKPSLLLFLLISMLVISAIQTLRIEGYYTDPLQCFLCVGLFVIYLELEGKE